MPFSLRSYFALLLFKRGDFFSTISGSGPAAGTRVFPFFGSRDDRPFLTRSARVNSFPRPGGARSLILDKASFWRFLVTVRLPLHKTPMAPTTLPLPLPFEDSLLLAGVQQILFHEEMDRRFARSLETSRPLRKMHTRGPPIRGQKPWLCRLRSSILPLFFDD